MCRGPHSSPQSWILLMSEPRLCSNPKGLFCHVSCVSYSYGGLPLTCAVVKCKCTFMKLKQQLPIKVLYSTSMFWMCTALYCWQCVYCIVCLCLYVRMCGLNILCIIVTLLLIKTLLLMQMNWYSILCLLLIWYWHFLLCNLNALSFSSLSHFH